MRYIIRVLWVIKDCCQIWNRMLKVKRSYENFIYYWSLFELRKIEQVFIFLDFVICYNTIHRTGIFAQYYFSDKIFPAKIDYFNIKTINEILRPCIKANDLSILPDSLSVFISIILEMFKTSKCFEV